MGSKVRKKIVSWDYAPGEDYFEELFRVSKEQIIWGGNYFALPPNRCFLVWEKTNIPEKFTMAMAEYAWCSFNDNPKIIKLSSGHSRPVPPDAEAGGSVSLDLPELHQAGGQDLRYAPREREQPPGGV